MVRAETGSGKTLAYLAPMYADLGERAPRVLRGDGTRALVMLPTRELCLQVRRQYTATQKGCESDCYGLARGDRKCSLNEGRIPHFRGVRVHVGTGYNRVEGNRRASRNGHAIFHPKPLVAIRNFFVAVRPPPSARASGARLRGEAAAAQVAETALKLSSCYHWLVAGSLLGGENRTHEKARLRKGVVVLTASPGRLLDHLQHTSSFLIDMLAWLVLVSPFLPSPPPPPPPSLFLSLHLPVRCALECRARVR
jgi:hypothetical protein